MNPKHAIVHHRDETPPLECPYGNVQRVITGGDGGVANVHVVKITQGSAHFHAAYDEVYFVLSGCGSIDLAMETRPLRPGSAVVIPAGVVHSLQADSGQQLEFVIFGTPALSIDDDRARPRKPEESAPSA